MSHFEITHLLQRINEGSDDLWAKVIEQIYGELKQITHQARGKVVHKLHPTFDTNAVLTEAFASLYDSKQIVWQDRKHFYLTFAQACRYVITVYDRGKTNLKRGSHIQFIPVDQIANVEQAESFDVQFDLNNALDILEKINKRAWEGVMLRFYTGLKESEIAEIQQVSTRTVIRDWIAARAILANVMQGNI